MSDAKDRLARALGVVTSYDDATGQTHELSAASRDAILAGFGVDSEDAARERLQEVERPRILPLWQVVDCDGPVRLPALEGRDWQLTCEDGEARDGRGTDLGMLPAGIHRVDAGEAGGWLLAAPATLPVPPLSWGVTLPLYGLAEDGRLGSYADLGRAATALGRAGADFVGVNPVHAGFPDDTQAFSPYSPAHRGRLSVVHVAPQDEAAIPAEDLLDYDQALPARMSALRDSYAPDEGFTDWRAAQGPELERFALHQALSAAHGPYWPDWPAALHDPDGAAAQRFAQENPDAVSFHAWLQYRAEQQLAEAQEAALAAGMRFGLYLDLAVGTHPAGAETWGQPDLFAAGVSLGAPPDAFSAEGQSWGLAPMRPDTLAEDGFRPLQAILRRALSHAKLLRIDHVLGFERAFWVPEDDVPGAYVTMPREALLAVARIEATRAGATIVGEDLGNIPKGLRGALAESGLLGCRVAQFERDWDAGDNAFCPATAYEPSALTSWGSHDLPTWEGWKQGRDIDWRRKVGDLDDAGHAEQSQARDAAVTAFCDLIGGDGMDDLHRFLSATPSRLVVAQIEDLLGRVEQPNLPGTIHQHPNWRRRIGMAPDELGSLDAVARTASIMRDAGR